VRFSVGGAIVAAAVLSGCAAQQQSAGIAEPDYPIDYQQQIIRNKANLFKDPDSIRDAAIASPTPSMMGWQVCMQANAKNSFGGYTGRQTFIVQIYRNGAPPILLPTTIYDSCSGFVPFPEIEGGYVPPKPAIAQPLPKKRT
jgi:hypothetical protein